MKKVISTSVCLIIYVLTFATNIDTVQIKGYYTVIYPKEEILKVLNIKLEYYETGMMGALIDSRRYFNFVPLQIDTAIINTDSTVIKAILRDSSVWYSNVYYIMHGTYVCNKDDIKKDIQKYFGIKININKMLAIQSNLDQRAFLYASSSKPNNLYMIVYIEGTAIKTVLPRDYKILPACIDYGYMTKKEFDTVELYYIIDITKYNPIVNLDGFNFWYPYIDS